MGFPYYPVMSQKKTECRFKPTEQLRRRRITAATNKDNDGTADGNGDDNDDADDGDDGDVDAPGGAMQTPGGGNTDGAMKTLGTTQKRK